MEKISFSYTLDGDQVIINKSTEDGLSATDMCDAFVDFMRALGFSEERIAEYFI